MELTPFQPGNFLHRLDVECGALEPRKGRIRVKVPARTHLSVLDMNYFSPGNPGGGGVGYAVGLYAEVEMELQEAGNFHIEAKREGVVRHVASIVARTVGYQGGLRIKARDHNINHMGLGSTSALMTAVACGVNHLLGEPLDTRSLRRVIGYNFAEDAEGGMVVPGFETGVGPAAGIHGGFVVLTHRLELVQHSLIPDSSVYLVFLKEDLEEHVGDQGNISSSKNAAQLEADLLLNKARDMDKKDAREKSHELLFTLLPGLKAGDFRAVGDAIWRLQHLGSKVAEVQYHRNPKRIYQVMEECRRHGALVVGMSSVGPAITILCERDLELEAKLEAYLQGEDVEYIKTQVDNQGVVVEEITFEG